MITLLLRILLIVAMHQHRTQLAITLDLRPVLFGEDGIVWNAFLLANHSLCGGLEIGMDAHRNAGQHGSAEANRFLATHDVQPLVRERGAQPQPQRGAYSAAENIDIAEGGAGILEALGNDRQLRGDAFQNSLIKMRARAVEGKEI